MQDEIEEINLYCDFKSIYVVTNKKRLLKLKCPFKVVVIHAIYHLKKGDIKIVDEIKMDRYLQLVYVIETKPYLYYLFRIHFEL